jgi:hypothetical protein
MVEAGLESIRQMTPSPLPQPPVAPPFRGPWSYGSGPPELP